MKLRFEFFNISLPWDLDFRSFNEKIERVTLKMAKFMETGVRVMPNPLISEAIDLYNAINSLPLFPGLQKDMLRQFERLLYRIVAEIPDNYVNYMWMHMISVFQFHGYYSDDIQLMNYYHVKKAIQRMLTSSPYLRDGKVEVDGEISYLFNGSPEQSKKHGYYNLALGDSSPRSTLIHYIEDAIRDDSRIKKESLPPSGHYDLSQSV